MPPEFCRIPLVDRRGHVVAYALVDSEDADRVVEHRWRRTTGYAARSIIVVSDEPRPYTSLMHRELMGLQRGDGREVDHINGDRLDNRRSNLRVVSRRLNGQNLPSFPGTSSRFRGVTWVKARGNWQAQARMDGCRYFLGRYDSEEEAAAVVAAWRAENMPGSVEALERKAA